MINNLKKNILSNFEIKHTDHSIEILAKIKDFIDATIFKSSVIENDKKLNFVYTNLSNLREFITVEITSQELTRQLHAKTNESFDLFIETELEKAKEIPKEENKKNKKS